MMKKGRPKDIKSKKGRMHTIILSEKAESCLRQIKKKRVSFNLSRYLSEHIILDFDLEPDKFLKTVIAKNNIEIERLYQENKKIADNIMELKNNKQEKLLIAMGENKHEEN